MEDKERFKKKAVALRYRPPEDSVPRIAAKGKGLVADKIIELARKYRIPIREDPQLVQILSQLDLGQEIPPSLYPVVAEVLAFIYSLEGRWKKKEEENFIEK